MSKTVLYEKHLQLGAKIVDFAGWEMPLQYSGIIPEHLAVRNNVGLFDVSHMGRISVEGPDAINFLDYISTNQILGKQALTSVYTVWSKEDGGCVDDVIVYIQGSEKAFVIVNASNREKDLDHLRRESSNFNVAIVPHFDEGILAVQGPKSSQLIAEIFPDSLQIKPMHFEITKYKGQQIILSATGYTGEKGFEIYASSQTIEDLWDTLLKLGQPYGIQPAGLGARDSLRLEMGYALYGHEISDVISANESVSSWTIKWTKPHFLGKSFLERLQASSLKRSEYGVILIDPGIAREGYPIFKSKQQIGIVTSGGYSPCLKQSIAIILTQNKLETDEIVEVLIRQNPCKAKVVKLPFLKK